MKRMSQQSIDLSDSESEAERVEDPALANTQKDFESDTEQPRLPLKLEAPPTPATNPPSEVIGLSVVQTSKKRTSKTKSAKVKKGSASKKTCVIPSCFRVVFFYVLRFSFYFSA